MDSQEEVESDAAGDPPNAEQLGADHVDPEDAALLAEIRAAYERNDPVPRGLAERTTPPID